MPVSESQRQAAVKWDKANMVNVCCRLTRKKKEVFQRACEQLGTTMNAVFMKAVDETIAAVEKRDQEST